MISIAAPPFDLERRLCVLKALCRNIGEGLDLEAALGAEELTERWPVGINAFRQIN
jgi:hypothetical protein